MENNKEFLSLPPKVVFGKLLQKQLLLLEVREKIIFSLTKIVEYSAI
jgi:hypothetical protein